MKKHNPHTIAVMRLRVLCLIQYRVRLRGAAVPLSISPMVFSVLVFIFGPSLKFFSL